MRASRVIKIAEMEEGYLEKKSNKNLDDKLANAGSNNFTKYSRDLVKWVGKPYDNGVYWCDIFVDWCMVKACIDEYGATDGIKIAKNLLGGWSAYTPTSAQMYKNNKRWYTTPKAGDQIFFKNSVRIHHTGLVYKVDKNNVYTIEGNTSSANRVIANGGGVRKKCYALNNKSIAGYGRPNYESETVEVVKESNVIKKVTASISAKSYDKNYSGTYKVTTSLNMRNDAGKDNKSLVVMKKGTSVKCYGYYTEYEKTPWLYVVAVIDGVEYTGYASSKYLTK